MGSSKFSVLMQSCSIIQRYTSISSKKLYLFCNCSNLFIDITLIKSWWEIISLQNSLISGSLGKFSSEFHWFWYRRDSVAVADTSMYLTFIQIYIIFRLKLNWKLPNFNFQFVFQFSFFIYLLSLLKLFSSIFDKRKFKNRIEY